jgi:hypothetical protein
MHAAPFNNWNVSYSVITNFERALRGHTKVKEFKRTRDILFDIHLTNEEEIKVLLVDEYTLGLAAVHRAMDEFPGIEFIVTGGNWNGYTPQAKEWGMDHDIGIFNIEEFLGALNWTEPKKYHKKDSNGKPMYAYHDAT